MAFITQDKKKALAPAIKAVLKKYDVKGTIGIDNHSTLVVNVKSGVLDFIGEANRKNVEHAERRGEVPYVIEDNYQANSYHAHNDEGVYGEFFTDLITAMKGNAWYDKTDAMVDYFDISYYLSINIGKWDKPYILTK